MGLSHQGTNISSYFNTSCHLDVNNAQNNNFEPPRRGVRRVLSKVFSAFTTTLR